VARHRLSSGEDDSNDAIAACHSNSFDPASEISGRRDLNPEGGSAGSQPKIVLLYCERPPVVGPDRLKASIASQKSVVENRQTGIPVFTVDKDQVGRHYR
jgi:hypothetical protein